MENKNWLTEISGLETPSGYARNLVRKEKGVKSDRHWWVEDTSEKNKRTKESSSGLTIMRRAELKKLY